MMLDKLLSLRIKLSMSSTVIIPNEFGLLYYKYLEEVLFLSIQNLAYKKQ